MEKCFEPGVVTPEDLLAYATGQADSRTATHIEACSFCAVEAASYAATDEALRSQLFRVDCPASQILGELALDLLDPKDALTVRSHLSLCPHCTAEFASLREAVQGDPLADLRPRPSRLGRIIARLQPSPGLGVATAGVRAAGESASRTYEAEGITISLSVEAERSGPARHWNLLGLVVDEIEDRVFTHAPMKLLRAEEVVSEGQLDEWGNVTFSGLLGGDYVLELSLPDHVIAVQGVQVGDG